MTHQPFACLSVVIPCYNERATIAEVLGQVLASPWTGEVIVVDDGSKDGSPEVVGAVADRRIRLLRQPRNQGKGAALRRGFVAATCDYVVVQDADLEYDPSEYGLLLGPLIDGRADVVYGSRFHTSAPHRVLYYWHSVGNKVLTTLSNMTTNLNLSDMETCYKAFRREVIQSIELEEDRFGFEPEVTAKIGAAGFRVYEVGISYRGRTYAEGKKIGWRDGLRALYCVGRYALPLARRELERPPPGDPASFSDADLELVETLENLDQATRYADWIVELARPYVRGSICEVGAGHGTLTARLAHQGSVVACDPSLRAADRLRDRFGDGGGVEVVHGEFEIAAKDRLFDSIVVVNVLEHIEDDEAALASYGEHLEPGGHVVVFAPALEGLYSEFDHKIGHWRRYKRSTLTRAMYRSGLEVVECRYVNALGALAWWVLAKQLRREPTAAWSVSTYDRMFVPWVKRLEARRGLPVGQSILCVGRRPFDDS